MSHYQKNELYTQLVTHVLNSMLQDTEAMMIHYNGNKYLVANIDNQIKVLDGSSLSEVHDRSLVWLTPTMTH